MFYLTNSLKIGRILLFSFFTGLVNALVLQMFEFGFSVLSFKQLDPLDVKAVFQVVNRNGMIHRSQFEF